MSSISEPALVAALATLAIASAIVSWRSWVLFLRTRKPRTPRYRGRHRTAASQMRTRNAGRTSARTR